MNVRKSLLFLVAGLVVAGCSAGESTGPRAQSSPLESVAESTGVTTPVVELESGANSVTDEAEQSAEPESSGAPSAMSSADEATGGSKVAIAEGNAMAIMTIGGSDFTIQLHDNDTVRDMAARSPIELTVEDYGGKEKAGTLPFRPITNGMTPSYIHKGEIYVYGSNSLVIFYHSEPNGFGGYTPVGVLENPDVLDAFIGSGKETLTIDFN